MQITVYNPQKGRLETINAEFTKNNTTRFHNCRKNSDIYMITDIDGNILVREFSYSYPCIFYDILRSDIDFNQKKAKQLFNRRE